MNILNLDDYRVHKVLAVGCERCKHTFTSVSPIDIPVIELLCPKCRTIGFVRLVYTVAPRATYCSGRTDYENKIE